MAEASRDKSGTQYLNLAELESAEQSPRSNDTSPPWNEISTWRPHGRLRAMCSGLTSSRCSVYVAFLLTILCIGLIAWNAVLTSSIAADHSVLAAGRRKISQRINGLSEQATNSSIEIEHQTAHLSSFLNMIKIIYDRLNLLHRMEQENSVRIHSKPLANSSILILLQHHAFKSV